MNILALLVASVCGMAIAVSAGMLQVTDRNGEPLDLSPDSPTINSGFGFLSDYHCVGRVFDEPRRMRMKCTKNPLRKMNCECKDTANSQQITCSCESPKTNGLKEVPLLDKSERVMQDDVDLDP